MGRICRICSFSLFVFMALLVCGFTPAAGQDVNVWVTQFGLGKATKLSVIGDSATVAATVNLSKPFPEDCVCDQQGRVYVDESNFADSSSIIERIETNLSLTTINTTIKGPEGPALDAAGNLFTNTRGGPGVHTGEWLFPVSTLQTPPNQSPILAVLPFSPILFGEGTGFLTIGPFAGQLIASGSTNVVRADVSGSLPAAAMPFITRPGIAIGIDVSPATGPAINAGDVVVSYIDRVERYDPSGTLSDAAYFTVPPGVFLLFCEFDDLGNLYVATDSGQIWKVHPDKTAVIINPANPLLSATGIAVCKGQFLTHRMTGGGTFGPAVVPPSAPVRHGFEVHCDPTDQPNNLEVNWPQSHFHMDVLKAAQCSNNPLLGTDPNAGFNTIEGNGTGSYNGQPNSTVQFTFTDNEGGSDSASITIKDPSGVVVLSASGNLTGGTQEAH